MIQIMEGHVGDNGLCDLDKGGKVTLLKLELHFQEIYYITGINVDIGFWHM